MGRRLVLAKHNGSNAGSRRHEERRALSAAEAAEFFNQLEAEAKADRSWKDMTAVEPDESDRWNEVEEHLLQKSHDHDHKLRRWKYFAK